MRITFKLAFCFGAFLAYSVAANAAAPESTDFGKTAGGEQTKLFTIQNGKGLVAKITDYGATLVELHVPDKNGDVADVILGFDDVSGYESKDNGYFGATTGRVCNRIAKGKFTLDGKEYSLAINNEPNHLHGGNERALSRVMWEANPFENKRGSGIRFKYTSPDGEEGYPGTLDLTVTYLIPKDKNILSIQFQAVTDKATPVNLTNHAYFNLAGHGAETIKNHTLKISADKFTPTDDTLIPTGEIASVEGTPLDFRKPKRIGKELDSLLETAAKGYDHNFVLNPGKDKNKPMKIAAMLFDKESGRRMRIFTTEPGLQFYTGNFLSGAKGKDGKIYKYQSACCLETQHYPDSINHESFPTTVLKPGDTFKSTTTFNFTAE